MKHLGKTVSIPSGRDPSILQPIERNLQRKNNNISVNFSGCDVWTIWEAYWLVDKVPKTGVLRISIDADSLHIVESKSLKLYVQGLNFVDFPSDEAYLETLATDLGDCLQAKIEVNLIHVDHLNKQRVLGINIDGSEITKLIDRPDPSVLVKSSPASEGTAQTAIFNSHLFRSMCPVTHQPDYASVMIATVGDLLNPTSLLTYLLGYRKHADFHENCCEQIFNHIFNAGDFQKLSVIMAFTRRGGIDITPMRWLKGQPKPEIDSLMRQ